MLNCSRHPWQQSGRRPAKKIKEACGDWSYRLCHHSKNDDNRPADEVAARWDRDPIKIHGGRPGLSVRAAIDSEVVSPIQDVIEQALAL